MHTKSESTAYESQMLDLPLQTKSMPKPKKDDPLQEHVSFNQRVKKYYLSTY